MNAGFDNLITLLIFVGIAIASAILNKRREKKQEEEQYNDLPPFPRQEPPPAPRTESRSRSWEDELRDLLEQAKPQPPPPPIRRDFPPPIPHVPPVYHPTPEPRYHQPEPEVLSNFAAAQERFTHAGEIQQRVAQQLLDAAEHRHKLVMARPTASRNALAARALLKDRDGIRKAVLARVILGPPKSLDE